MNLEDTIKQDIIRLARGCGVNKVILFGSRARGDYKSRSDIDLAVSGGDIARFRPEIDVEMALQRLNEKDVVNLDEPVQKRLLESIEKEGILLYEKI